MSVDKKSPVRVIPVRPATHKHFSDLIGIRGHRNYFVNLLSGKITFIQRGKKIPTGETSINSAKIKVQEILTALSTGKSITKIKREMRGISSPLVDDIWLELLETQEAGKEESTKKNYHKSWAYGLSFFWSGKSTLDVNDDRVEEFKREYLKTNPDRIFEHTEVHLKMLFRYMLKKGYIKRLPDTDVLKDVNDIIKKNRRWEKPGRVYTPKEISALLEASDGLAVAGLVGKTTTKHKQLLAIRARLGILLGLVGMRKQEALGLQWDKINFQKRIMTVWSRKNKKWREVPMTDEIFESLLNQKKNTLESPWVFPMPTNFDKPISSQVFDKVWVRVKEAAKITDWNVEDKARFHDLRHTFATLTAEMGWPPKVACDVLDMSLSIYDKVYSHPSGAKKSEWMARTFDTGKKL
jgi:integrase